MIYLITLLITHILAFYLGGVYNYRSIMRNLYKNINLPRTKLAELEEDSRINIALETIKTSNTEYKLKKAKDILIKNIHNLLLIWEV